MDSEESLPADGSSGAFNPSSNGSLFARRTQRPPLQPYTCTPLGMCARKPIVLSTLMEIETRK